MVKIPIILGGKKQALDQYGNCTSHQIFYWKLFRG